MRGFLAIAVVTLFALSMGSAQAQEVSKTCDITVQNQMKQQGWLEGQRELELAQRLILKPDSVLEYSCFERVAKNFAVASNPSWNFVNFGGGLPSGNIGNAVNSLVLSSFYPYLDNFGHLFLGGTFGDEGTAFTGTLANPDSLCNPHYWIWFLAKCANASWEKKNEADDKHMNFFFPLEKLVNRNIRNKPQSCPTPDITLRNQLVTDVQAKQEAFPDPAQNPPLGVDNASKITGTAGGKKYSVILNATECGAPVKTGVKVQALGGGGVQDDIVCVAPGCYPSGGSCSK